MSPHAPPLRGSPPPEGGFTLIELLVAISIMAVMTVMAWRGLDGMQSATQQTRVHSDAVLTLEAGLGQWGADLDAMVAPGASTHAPVAMEWDGRALRLTRRNAAEPDAGLVVVAWTRGNREGTAQWLRWQSAPVRLHQEWQAAWDGAAQWAQSPSDSARQREIAIVALEQWQIYYYRGGAWSNPLSSSGDAATPGARTALPDGVRLVLGVAAPHPLAGSLTRDWASPLLTGNTP
jgi:general secretion pathway protein J